MKKGCIVIIFLVLVAGSVLGNQQITRIGIVDSQRIADTFIAKSQAYLDYVQLKKDLDAQVAEIQQQIADLEEQVITARQAGDTSRAMKLENESIELNNHLRAFIRLGKNKAQAAQQEIAESDDFYMNMVKAIDNVAETEGFSLVFDKALNRIWYYIDEVDITDEVITALNRIYK